MYRQAIKSLQTWKESVSRKPLIVQGARQVGKTWILKEFGRTHYDHVAYINFENAHELQTLFEHSLRHEDIILGLEIYLKQKITPDSTLIIFDEIQEQPRALTSLKYFCEEAPEYHIVCAGSLLGVALHAGTSFPVGKVDFMELRPLSFSEFLLAVGDEQLVELPKQKKFDLVAALKDTYIERLKQYYFIGGMPEVVRNFAENRDYFQARGLQESILSAYEQDFSKHAPSNVVPRIREVWNSLPAQLSKENKKFVYGLIRDGARAKEYESAILWLNDCGLLHKVCRTKSPKIPLRAYEDSRAFKLFSHDVGLLGCMAKLDSSSLLLGNSIFTEFKGALTEQFVCQELMCRNLSNLFYYTNDRGNCEVDFVSQIAGEVVPIEVKAETNLKAKSLHVYREKFQPSHAVRISMADYKFDDGLLNIPLYLIGSLTQHLNILP